MKKLILIFGTFAIICVIISYSAEQKITQNFNTDTTQTQNVQNPEVYTVKSENGKVVVYQGDTLLHKTSTATSTLPKRDQKILLYGISASSKEELNKILENYLS